MKKVAILGTAPSAKFAPFNDPSWIIWGVGARLDCVTRADRWYELHRLDGEPIQWATEWRASMKQWCMDCELWMIHPEPLADRIVQMNIKPLIEKYGTFFMTSSFSWMMAQALEEGFSEIGLWGVDMEYGTEYRQQRTGLRHFIEIAKLMGIKVTRVVSSGIAYEPVPYPMWQDDPVISKNVLRQKALKEQITSCKYTFEKTRDEALKLQGAKEFAAGLIEIGTPITPPDLKKNYKKIEEEFELMLGSSQIARDDLKIAEGALSECKWLEDYLQP